MSPWPVPRTARRRLERLLEVRLPAAVRAVDHVRWAPESSLSLSVDVARLRLPRDDARALVRALGLRPRGQDPLTDVLLGTGWHTALEHAPPWWPSDPDALDDQAATARGDHGWTVAGYGSPYLYLLTTTAAAPHSDRGSAAPGG